MISAGLFYGQYLSQYDARALASNNEDQSKNGSQLLLGPEKNDRHAARSMHLTFLEWDPDSEQSTHDFLAWIKQNIANNAPVAIGIYMNTSVFGDDSDDDDEYDHIVPVIGIESNHPLSDASYYDDDVIVFSDNGLYTPDGEPVPYIFKYPFGCFQKTRQDANESSAPPYSLALLTEDVKNYGIALTGIVTDGSTLPVQVATNVNYEHPEISDGSTVRPSPMPLKLTVTVSGLEPGVRYKLYRYDIMENVPNGQFNKYASSAVQPPRDILADSTSMSYIDANMSDEVAVYRAVKASAP